MSLRFSASTHDVATRFLGVVSLGGWLLVGACTSETSSTPAGTPQPATTATDPTYGPGGEGEGDKPAKLTAYSEVEVQALFDKKCVKCHDARSPNLDLSEPFAVTTIGVKTGGAKADTTCGQTSAFKIRIKPGDREGSLLWHKVKGTQDCGKKMPYDAGNAPLDATQLERLGLYIDALPR